MAIPPIDMEAFQSELQRIAAEQPPLGISWSMVYSAAILRALERRFPGFADEAKAEVERAIAKSAASEDPEDVADVESMRELLDSGWFIVPPVSDE